MEYRSLGKTGLKVSAIGLGTSQLGTMRTERAVEIVHRALDLGVTYFDTARRFFHACDTQPRSGRHRQFAVYHTRL